MAFSFMATIGGDGNPLRRELRSLESHSGRAGNSIGRSITSAIATRFGGLVAVFKGLQFAKEAVQVDIAMQSMRNTLQTVSGSAVQAQSDIDFLRSASDRLGFSFLESGRNFARFSVAATASNLTAAETRKVFLGVQEAALVMGLTTDQTGATMLALEQMLSKGTVMSQELRLQLGNAMPGAISIFARALGVSVSELMKLVEDGLVPAKEAVKLFGIELNKAFTLTPEANKTQREITRMTNSIIAMKAVMGENLRPQVSAGTKTVGGFASFGEDPLLYMILNKVTPTKGVPGSSEISEYAAAMQRIFDMEDNFAKNQKAKDIAGQPAAIAALKKKIAAAKVEADLVKQRKEIAKLEDKIYEEQQKRSIVGESPEEKRLRLLREIAELEFHINQRGISHAGRAELLMKQEERRTDLAELADKEETKSEKEAERARKRAEAAARRGGFPSSTQESHGLFGVGVGNPVLSVNQSMDATLKRIERKLSPTVYARSSRRGVNFGGSLR